VPKELGLNRFVSEQPTYNILDRRIERELVPMAQTFGIGLIPWSPIAGGLLSGKYRCGEPPPAGTRFADPNTLGRDRRLKDEVFNVVEQLERIAQTKDCTMVQLSLAWVMAQQAITFIGPRTLAQLDEYLGAPAVTLTETDRWQIDTLVNPVAWCRRITRRTSGRTRIAYCKRSARLMFRTPNLTTPELLQAAGEVERPRLTRWRAPTIERHRSGLERVRCGVALDGWRADVTRARKRSDLPTQARTYVDYIEVQLGVPITMISVGPEREQIILG